MRGRCASRRVDTGLRQYDVGSRARFDDALKQRASIPLEGDAQALFLAFHYDVEVAVEGTYGAQRHAWPILRQAWRATEAVEAGGQDAEQALSKDPAIEATF